LLYQFLSLGTWLTVAIARRDGRLLSVLNVERSMQVILMKSGCLREGRSFPPGDFLLEVKTVKGRAANPPPRTSDVIAKQESTERMLRAFIAQEKIQC